MRLEPPSRDFTSFSKKVTLAIKLTVTTAVILYLYNNIEINKLGFHLAESSKPHISLAFLLTGTLFLSLAFRWWTVCRISSVKIDLASCCRFTFIGFFFNNFMLGSIGGDGVKCVLAARRSQSSNIAVVLSVLADRSVGLLMFISALILFWDREIEEAIFSKIQGNDLGQHTTTIGVSALITFIGLAMIFKKSNATRQFCKEQLIKARELKLDVSQLGLLRTAGWLSIATVLPPILLTLIWVNIALSIGLQLSFAEMLVVVSAVAIATALPISFSGHGVRELSLIFCFTVFLQNSHSPQEIINLTLSFSLFSFLSFAGWSILGGLTFLLSEKKDAHQI